MNRKLYNNGTTSELEELRTDSPVEQLVGEYSGNNAVRKLAPDQCQVNEGDVLINAKESRERLMLTHDTLKEKLNSIMQQMIESTTPAEKLKLNELFKEIKVCLGRCELGVSDSMLLMHLAEYLQALEKTRIKFRAESRRLHIENKKLKILAADALDSVFRKEAQLVTVSEEKKHWFSMCQMSKLQEAAQIVDEEYDMWDDTIFPDTLWEQGAPEIHEKQLKATYDQVADQLSNGKVLDALQTVKTYYASKDDNTTASTCANEAIMLTKVAKVCADQGYLNDGLDLLDQSLKLRIKAYGETHKLVIGTLNNKAIMFWKLGQMKRAAASAFDALKLMEKSTKNVSENTDIAKQYLRTGFLMTKWGYSEDGIKLMELAAMTFENLLPEEEDNWMKAVVKLARACNDTKAYEDAMCVCCELIDYYHQKSLGAIGPSNRTIYEIAAEQQDAETEGKPVPLEMPPSIFLPGTVISALRELAIVFSSYYLFTAAKVIDKWIEQCMGNNEYYNIVEKAHQRVYQIMGKEKGGAPAVETPQMDTKRMKRTIALDGSGTMKVISNDNEKRGDKTQKGLMKQVNSRLNTIFKNPKGGADDDDDGIEDPKKKKK